MSRFIGVARGQIPFMQQKSLFAFVFILIFAHIMQQYPPFIFDTFIAANDSWQFPKRVPFYIWCPGIGRTFTATLALPRGPSSYTVILNFCSPSPTS